MINKRIALAFSTIILASAVSQAIMAPWYENLRKIDTAVEEVATNFFKYDDVDEAPISSIEVKEDGKIVIGISETVCTVEVAMKLQPPGMMGAPSLDAKILGECEVIRADLKTAKYEKIAEKMNKAAALAKMVQKVTITSKGGIKIGYKK